MDHIMNMFNELARQHTVLTYELNRLKSLRKDRQGRGVSAASETDYEIKLETRVAALSKACTGLAEFIESL